MILLKKSEKIPYLKISKMNGFWEAWGNNGRAQLDSGSNNC